YFSRNDSCGGRTICPFICGRVNGTTYYQCIYCSFTFYQCACYYRLWKGKHFHRHTRIFCAGSVLYQYCIRAGGGVIYYSSGTGSGTCAPGKACACSGIEGNGTAAANSSVSRYKCT